MNESLKAKLREILSKLLSAKNPRPEIGVDAREWASWHLGEMYLNKVIAQIDQAYKDAGYYELAKVVAAIDEIKADMMTGPEFYARFEKEYDKLGGGVPREKAFKAVRRAAGLGEL